MNKKRITTLLLSSLVASSLTIQAGAANDKQVLRDETGAIHDVVGHLGQVAGATPEQRALNALDKVAGDFGFTTASGHFKLNQSHQDEMGTTHTKLDRLINGIQVFNQQMIVHEQGGELLQVTGDYRPLTATTSHATLSQADAIQKAVAATGYTGTLTTPAATELIYVPQGDKAVLSYEVNVHYGGSEAGNWQIFVNATDGSIVKSINNIETYLNATGSGTGVLGDTKTIHTSLYTSTYYLEDHTKAMTGDIETYDFRNGTSTQYYFTDADNVWNATNQRAGVDAHYYAGKVYDYYKGLGRNSIDNNQMPIYSGVHYGMNYNNAYWDSQQMEMVYGDGDGVQFIAFSGDCDVPGHEMTHGVTQYTANLTYSNQSGALNESISDCAGVTIEGNNWLIGDEIYTPGTPGDALRSLEDPGLYGQPANMSQYVTTTSDNGGVHTNSGIPNHAYYLFATDIGSRTIAGKIWYVSLRDYMTSSTNFSGARTATLSACAALYGSGSSYYTALQNAWTGVGVY